MAYHSSPNAAFELAEIDADILRYIYRHEPVAIEEVERAIPDSLVQHRVVSMSGSGWYDPRRNDTPAPSLITLDHRVSEAGRIEYLGTCRLTDHGKKVLQDYDKAHRAHRKEFWLKNAWIPIIVAFVTTVITNYILPKLPLLIQWFASIL